MLMTKKFVHFVNCSITTKLNLTKIVNRLNVSTVSNTVVVIYIAEK